MVCKERGCGNPVATTPTVNFGQGSGQIWMEGLGCTGREASFKDCPFNGWGVTVCTHAEDVSVTCLGKNKPYEYKNMQADDFDCEE